MTRIYKNIVILSGAGISAESGLATFRDSNGLWNNHRVEDVATIEAFERNPDYVHDFYNAMRPELFAAKPNPAHFAITELQQKYPADVSVITQNVDAGKVAAADRVTVSAVFDLSYHNFCPPNNNLC